MLFNFSEVFNSNVHVSDEPKIGLDTMNTVAETPMTAMPLKIQNGSYKIIKILFKNLKFKKFIQIFINLIFQ